MKWVYKLPYENIEVCRILVMILKSIKKTKDMLKYGYKCNLY